MKLKKLTYLGAILLWLGPSAWAAKEHLSKVAPGAKVVKEDGDTYEVMTPKNTIVEVEFNSDGTIDEASGTAADAGDMLTPGQGLIPLNAAVDALKKSGKKVAGEWSLEKSFTNGWVYEFQGVEGNKRMDYVVSATDGRLIKSDKDN